MVGADIAVATVLISMGALLGRTTAIQLMVMGVFEIALFAANEYFQLEYMKITDVGGSITVHAFGAYFGLAVSLMLRPSSKGEGESESEGASYNSDTFAMVGTLFLWIFWPSFNSVLVDGADQERAILNTYLSLAAATGDYEDMMGEWLPETVAVLSINISLVRRTVGQLIKDPTVPSGVDSKQINGRALFISSDETIDQCGGDIVNNSHELVGSVF